MAGKTVNGSHPYALRGSVLTPNGVWSDAAVVIREGKIIAVGKARDGDLPEDVRVVSGLIVPGFIDLQNNGSFGRDVIRDRDSLEVMSAALVSTGVTSFYPTIISSQRGVYDEVLPRIAEAASRLDLPGAAVLGSHVEGPFLAPEQKGTHRLENIIPIDMALLERMVSYGKVKLVTLAPELPGAGAAIRYLVSQGIVVSAGHTNGEDKHVRAAAELGLTLGTHLYNQMTRHHRDKGVAEFLLTDDRMRVGIIADGVHVHANTLWLTYQAVGSEKLVLVTDAMEAAGRSPGRYRIGDVDVTLEEAGGVYNADGRLAGSALTLDRAVHNAVHLMGATVEDAIRMATETPAKAMGLSTKGRLAVGADADITVLDNESLRVNECIVAGQSRYVRKD